MPNYANLDDQLRPLNSPMLSGSISTPYDFNSNVDRNTVNSYSLGTISASKIVAGTISGSVIYAGTITGSQINGGTLTLGGTANGNGLMKINNASGTTIVQGDNTGHHYYTTAGSERVRLNDSGLSLFGTVGDLVKFYETTSSTATFGRMYYGKTGTVNYFIVDATDQVLAGGLNLFAKNVSITDGASTPEQSIYMSPGYVSITGGALSAGTVAINGYSDVNINTTVDDINLNAGDDVRITCDSFVVNGATKTAIVRTKEDFRALYAVESPEVWFMDFAPAIGAVDPMFREVTEEPYHYIKCVDDYYQVWGKRKGFGTTRFEKKTATDFYVNNMLYSGKFIKDELNKRLKENKIKSNGNNR